MGERGVASRSNVVAMATLKWILLGLTKYIVVFSYPKDVYSATLYKFNGSNNYKTIHNGGILTTWTLVVNKCFFNHYLSPQDPRQFKIKLLKYNYIKLLVDPI